MILRVLVPVLGLALAACSNPATAPADGKSVIEVTGAFVVKPPEGRDVTAGGMTVSVTGAPVDLVAITTSSAEHVELHTMTMDDGGMQMRQVDHFTASEGSPIVLERGGNHMMLFGFDSAVQPGDTLDLSLEFRLADGESQTVVTTADVRNLGD